VCYLSLDVPCSVEALSISFGEEFLVPVREFPKFSQVHQPFRTFVLGYRDLAQGSLPCRDLATQRLGSRRRPWNKRASGRRFPRSRCYPPVVDDVPIDEKTAIMHAFGSAIVSFLPKVVDEGMHGMSVR
jgi:hypothetical protein